MIGSGLEGYADRVERISGGSVLKTWLKPSFSCESVREYIAWARLALLFLLPLLRMVIDYRYKVNSFSSKRSMCVAYCRLKRSGV